MATNLSELNVWPFFELVKNAYDADASKVVVCLDISEGQESKISVRDDGEGMTLERLGRFGQFPEATIDNSNEWKALEQPGTGGSRLEKKGWVASLFISLASPSLW